MDASMVTQGAPEAPAHGSWEILGGSAAFNTSAEATALAQTVSRFESALGEMRMAQAQMQVEVLRLGQRVDAAQHLILAAEQSASSSLRPDSSSSEGFAEVLSGRLDGLSDDIRRERHRRTAAEVLLQKAVGEISRAMQESNGRRTPREGSPSLRPVATSSSSMVEDLLQQLDDLRASDSASPPFEARVVRTQGHDVAKEIEGAIALDRTCSSSSTAPDFLATAVGSSPAREAYAEHFAKKARSFEQAVNMIESTAASVTKRLEAVVSESSAAMRREACDRAQAKAEIQRALQEIRNASDRASAYEPSGSAQAKVARPRSSLGSGSLGGGMAMPSPGLTIGAPGGDAAGGGIGVQRMSSSSLAPVGTAYYVEAGSMTPGDEISHSEPRTITRCGSESVVMLGSEPVNKVSGGIGSSQSASGSSHVIRASSQPQHSLSHDSRGNHEAVIIAAQSMKDVSASHTAASELAAIAEQQQSSMPSPRKHVVLAPKTLGSANGGGTGTSLPSSMMLTTSATALQAGTYGGSALFRQVQIQGGAPPPSLPSSSSPSTISEVSRVSQSRLIASTPRPGKQSTVTSPPPQPHTPTQHQKVSGQHTNVTTSTALPRQGAQVQQQSQQTVKSLMPRTAGDTTPVACGPRPGSVPPGMRVPGRSLATGSSVMRFTSK